MSDLLAATTTVVQSVVNLIALAIGAAGLGFLALAWWDNVWNRWHDYKHKHREFYDYLMHREQFMRWKESKKPGRS